MMTMMMHDRDGANSKVHRLRRREEEDRGGGEGGGGLETSKAGDEYIHTRRGGRGPPPSSSLLPIETKQQLTYPCLRHDLGGAVFRCH